MTCNNLSQDYLIKNNAIFSPQQLDNQPCQTSPAYQKDSLKPCSLQEERTLPLNPQLPPDFCDKSYIYSLYNLSKFLIELQKSISNANKIHIEKGFNEIETRSFELFTMKNNTDEQEGICKNWKTAQAITTVAVTVLLMTYLPTALPTALPKLLNISLIGTFKVAVTTQKNARDANLAHFKAEEAQKKESLDCKSYRLQSLVKTVEDSDILTDAIKDLAQAIQTMSNSVS